MQRDCPMQARIQSSDVRLACAKAAVDLRKGTTPACAVSAKNGLPVYVFGTRATGPFYLVGCRLGGAERSCCRLTRTVS
jgi:hypothetical protein